MGRVNEDWSNIEGEGRELSGVGVELGRESGGSGGTEELGS